MGLRLLKVNESIKETLSSVITAEGLKDPRIGFVTVTGVETSADLRHAKVYVSVLGGKTERELTMKALEKSRGFLQAKINASLHMKRTPQLQFFYDETLDNALRIQRALKREAEALGLAKIFTDAGAEWRASGCSMCLGMNGDLVDAGLYCVSTSNRNFEGRQGAGSRTLLASPATAAAAAIRGCVTDPREFIH